MAEGTLRGPEALAPAARHWRRISPRLVPVFAVITALIISMLFMMLSTFIRVGSVDIGAELNKTGTAYSALVEGSLGIVINNVMTANNLNLAQTFASSGEFSPRQVNQAARTAGDVASLGLENALRYYETFSKLDDLTDEEIDELGGRIDDIAAIGDETLLAMTPLLNGLAELERDQAEALIAAAADGTMLAAAARTALETAVPAAVEISDEDIIVYAKIIDDEGLVKMQRVAEQAVVLDSLELTSTSPEAADIIAIARGTAANMRERAAFAAALQSLGILDPAALSSQLRLVRDLYDAQLLTSENAALALNEELEPLLQNALVVLRPNNQILFTRAAAPAGIIYNNNRTPDDPTDDKPDAAYLRLGNSALLFLPANLENMLVRSIPFIIAGLAVALGFKAGLFNIGAEGQLYAGGTLAAWVGFSPLFASSADCSHPLDRHRRHCWRSALGRDTRCTQSLHRRT